ncbi:unnamed protein product [Moneuplotes crassus]|uniref:Uncharacterized protein n=1 Tax=Euplotes crassus TaxID=5936 RepID=A0AAD2D4R3_EUPCR|nr:unnamed protein product [Moneuplotes crassus]
MKAALVFILALFVLGAYAQETQVEDLVEKVAPKKAPATPGNIFMLILCLSATAYGLNYLNTKHRRYCEKVIMDEDFGKVPMYKINPQEIIDTSCKTELYCEDKQSGLLDILNKVKEEPEVYEMAYYESTSKKLESNPESSFMLNASVRTADDLELHGFDKAQNEYEVPTPKFPKWGALGRIFQNERESLL